MNKQFNHRNVYTRRKSGASLNRYRWRNQHNHAEYIHFSVGGVMLTPNTGAHERLDYEQRISTAFHQAAIQAGTKPIQHHDLLSLSLTAHIPTRMWEEGELHDGASDLIEILKIVRNGVTTPPPDNTTKTRSGFLDSRCVAKIDGVKLAADAHDIPWIDITVGIHRYQEPPRPVFNADGCVVGLQAKS